LRYFYDVSKNQTRRWCSMDVCGNRAKVAAYYHRAVRRRRHGIR
jgi:predicted RNA-binding Zn ribbon-like protein